MVRWRCEAVDRQSVPTAIACRLFGMDTLGDMTDRIAQHLGTATRADLLCTTAWKVSTLQAMTQVPATKGLLRSA